MVEKESGQKAQNIFQKKNLEKGKQLESSSNQLIKIKRTVAQIAHRRQKD